MVILSAVGTLPGLVWGDLGCLDGAPSARPSAGRLSGWAEGEEGGRGIVEEAVGKSLWHEICAVVVRDRTGSRSK